MLTVYETCERIRRVILNKITPAAPTTPAATNTARADPQQFWERIKKVMWDALRPFPDARVAMAEALTLLNEAPPAM